MFLRKNKRIKDGKPHVYWSLVETIRTAKGPRQRIVGYLGDLEESQEESYRGLIRRIEGQTQEQLSLLKPRRLGDPVTIVPEEVRVERVLDFGDAFLGVEFWKLLKLDAFFSQEIFRGKEDLPWDTVICFLVVSRFCQSMSKLSIVEQYVDQSALCDILGIDPLKINKDRLYRAMDVLLSHKGALGDHLKQRYGELFQLDYELFLYDMTSTYFEGQCPINPQAKRGHSRDHRSDCKQVTLALVVTKEGLPLYFEVFDGNRSDVTTVEEVVEYVESIYGKSQRVWVMDRGMVSEKNLKWLRKRGTAYIVGTPKSMLKKFEHHLLESDWETVHPDVEVKLVKTEEYPTEQFILSRSTCRREKEKAMVDLFSSRIEKGLETLAAAVSRTHRPLKDRDRLQRKIGALLKTNSRASRLFEIHVEERDQKLHLSWKRKTPLNDWADLSAGCYLLRSNLPPGLSASELWKAYITLTQVEETFRITKQDLGLRPVWHHEKERVQAHIFICFLSLVLQKTLELALASKGLGKSTRKVLEEFKTLKSMDVILPTTQGDELKIRKVSQPNPALKILLQHLRLKCPRRLTLASNVVEKLYPSPLPFQPLSSLLSP